VNGNKEEEALKGGAKGRNIKEEASGREVTSSGE